jgi:hypothetical protein
LKEIPSLLWLRLVCPGKTAERRAMSRSDLLIRFILPGGWNGLVLSRHSGVRSDYL